MKIHGSNLPMSVLGVLLLWVGWFGFNGGSTLALNEQVAGIIMNTFLAGASGVMVTLTVGWIIRKQADAELVIFGSIAGLVAITASAHAVSTVSALAIGGIGGIVMLGVDLLWITYTLMMLWVQFQFTWALVSGVHLLLQSLQGKRFWEQASVVGGSTPDSGNRNRSMLFVDFRSVLRSFYVNKPFRTVTSYSRR